MRCYYINLARRTDRRAVMEARLSGLGLEHERVEALTPADITPEQRDRYCDPIAYRWQSEGELACSLSHAQALRQFLTTGADWALILEDDVVLSPSLPALLAAIEAAEPKIDILRLETDDGRVRIGPEPIGQLGQHKLFRLYSAGGGAAAYIVNRHAAQYIANGDDILISQTDQALFDPDLPISRKLVIRQVEPALAIQEDRMGVREARLDTSDLEAPRKLRRTADGKNFWRRARHNFQDFIARDIVLATRNFWLQQTQGVTKRSIPFKPD